MSLLHLKQKIELLLIKYRLLNKTILNLENFLKLNQDLP